MFDYDITMLDHEFLWFSMFNHDLVAYHELINCHIV